MLHLEAASITGCIQLAWAKINLGLVSLRCRSSSADLHAGLVPETRAPDPMMANQIKGYQIYHQCPRWRDQQVARQEVKPTPTRGGSSRLGDRFYTHVVVGMQAHAVPLLDPEVLETFDQLRDNSTRFSG